MSECIDCGKTIDSRSESRCINCHQIFQKRRAAQEQQAADVSLLERVKTLTVSAIATEDGTSRAAVYKRIVSAKRRQEILSESHA